MNAYIAVYLLIAFGATIFYYFVWTIEWVNNMIKKYTYYRHPAQIWLGY